VSQAIYFCYLLDYIGDSLHSSWTNFQTLKQVSVCIYFCFLKVKWKQN